MRRSLISLTAAVTLAVSLASTLDCEGADLRRIRNLVKKKDYAGAERELREELPGFRGRNYVRALLLLARLEDDVRDVSSIYRKVISIGEDREALSAMLELAKIRYAVGEYGGVLEILSSIPSGGRSADRMEARYLRALSWKQLGDINRAGEELEKIDRGDLLYWSYMALAEIDMQNGRIEGAIERYETIGGEYSNPVAGFRLGECYEILGNRSKALKIYRSLMRQFPESLEAPKAREKIERITRLTRRRGDSRRDRRRGNTDSEEEATPVPSTAPLYAIQLGAFTERGNAIRLAEDIRSIIQDVRIESVEIGGSIWHRVRAGRYSSREEAEREAGRIRKETGYDCKILTLN